MNCDGTVAPGDIGPFIVALVDPFAYAAAYPDCDAALADLNADGRTDGADIATMVLRLVAP